MCYSKLSVPHRVSDAPNASASTGMLSLNSPSHVRHYYACVGQIGCKITHFLPNGQTAGGLKFNIEFEVVGGFAFTTGKIEAVPVVGPFFVVFAFGRVGFGVVGSFVKGMHKLFEILAVKKNLMFLKCRLL